MEPSFARMLKFNKEFPDSKEVYRCQQAWYLKNKPTNGLFCPSNTVIDFSPTIAATKQYANLLDGDYNKIHQMLKDINFNEILWGSHIYGAWRNTLSIYELDKDIADSAIKSTIPDDTPINIFKRLPEWCIYLKFPEKSVGISGPSPSGSGEIIGIYLDGFWASFDQIYEPKLGTHEKSPLSLYLTPNLVDKDNNPICPLQPVTLFIDDESTVEEALDNAYSFYKNLAEDLRGDSINTPEREENIQLCKEQDRQLAVGMLSSLLWLCAEEPDISNITGEPVSRSELQSPKHTVHPKTKNFITPSMPTVYSIGKRLGGEIRQMNDVIEHDKATNKGKGKRPHIRRGHWHGYWRGTGQAREFFVKWQPAVFVNAG